MVFGVTVHELLNQTIVRIVLTVLVVIIVQIIVRNSISHVIHRLVRGHKYESRQEAMKREDTLISIFRTAAAVVLWGLGIIVILGQLHVNIGALMTGAGVIGIVVGFGAQNAVKDILAGIFVIGENQYRVGDIVSLSAGGANISGVVEEITIRITRLRDQDGNVHIVPNGSAGVVTNLSFKHANVNVNLGVSYSADIDKVEKIINQVGAEIASDEHWEKSTLEPIKFIRIDSFDSSAVTVKAVGKVKPGTQWDIAGEFRRRIKREFDKNGIDIPHSNT